MKKGELFIKEVINRLKGDDKEALAAKIARKALSAVEGQLAALKSNKVDLEGSLEDATELLLNAKYPVEMIKDNQQYIRGIKNAQDAKDKCEEELKNVDESIKYFEELLASF